MSVILKIASRCFTMAWPLNNPTISCSLITLNPFPSSMFRSATTVWRWRPSKVMEGPEEGRWRWRTSSPAPECSAGRWPRSTPPWSAFSAWRLTSGSARRPTPATGRYGWSCRGGRTACGRPKWASFDPEPGVVVVGVGVNKRTKPNCLAVVRQGTRQPGGAAGGFLSQRPSLRLLWSQRSVRRLPDKKHLCTNSGECFLLSSVIYRVGPRQGG